MRDDDNPFLKILKAIEILQKEKEIFDREERKIIRSYANKKTIELFQTLALLAKKSEIAGIALYLINNHLRVTNFLETIDKMDRIYKCK